MFGDIFGFHGLRGWRTMGEACSWYQVRRSQSCYLQCTIQCSTTKSHLVQNVNSTKGEIDSGEMPFSERAPNVEEYAARGIIQSIGRGGLFQRMKKTFSERQERSIVQRDRCLRIGEKNQEVGITVRVEFHKDFSIKLKRKALSLVVVFFF